MSKIDLKSLTEVVKRNKQYMGVDTNRLLESFVSDMDIEQGSFSVVDSVYGGIHSQVNSSPLLQDSYYNRTPKPHLRDLYNLSEDRIVNLALCELTKRVLPPDILDFLIDEANMHRMVGDLIIHSARNTMYGSSGKYNSLEELPSTVIQVYNYFNELAIHYLNERASLGCVARKYREFFSYIAVTQAVYTMDTEHDDVRVLFNYSDGIKAIDTLPKYDSRIVSIYMDVINEGNEQGVASEYAMTQAMVYCFNLFFNSVFSMKMENQELQVKVAELANRFSNDMYETQMMFKGLSTIDDFENSDRMKEYKKKREVIEDSIIDNLYLQYECISSSLLSRILGPMNEIYESTVVQYHDEERDLEDTMNILEGTPKLMFIFNDVSLNISSKFIASTNHQPIISFIKSFKEKDVFEDYKKYINLDDFTVHDFNYMFSVFQETLSILGNSFELLKEEDYDGVVDYVSKLCHELSVPFPIMISTLLTLHHWIQIIDKLFSEDKDRVINTI